MDQACQLLRLVIGDGIGTPALPNGTGQVVQAGHCASVINRTRHLFSEHAVPFGSHGPVTGVARMQAKLRHREKRRFSLDEGTVLRG